MKGDISRLFLDGVKDRLGSRLISAYSLRQYLFLVLKNERFINSLKELNRTWLELGSPELQLWPIVYRRSDLPIIEAYGVNWNPFLTSEFMEQGSLIYGPNLLKVDSDGLLKARLMLCNQWGASYEGLPDIIETAQNTSEVREELLKDMRLLMKVRGKVPPSTESDLLNALFRELQRNS